MFLTVSLVVVLVAVAELWRRWRRVHTHHTDKIPGPPCLPIIGNSHQVKGDSSEFYEQLQSNWEKYGKETGVYRVWLGTRLMCFISKPEFVERLLTSTKQITKAHVYDLAVVWLGTGLLISNGEKWKSRRKLITPTFHFKILSDFIEVFNDQSLILIDIVRKAVREGSSTNPNFSLDIAPYFCRCGLDTLCLTAMGVNVHAQSDGFSDYANANQRVAATLIWRMKTPWTWWNAFFFSTPIGRNYLKDLRTVHGFTEKVIEERSVIMDQMIASGEAHEFMRKIDFGQTSKPETTSEIKKDLDDDTGAKKRRMVFLDMLLYHAKTTGGLTKLDIREEVDTFMFEGHDTTASAISFLVFLMGLHEDMQERLHQEILDVTGDEERRITPDDLPQLTYMDRVIKEAARIYPTVPFYGREMIEDFDIGDGFVLPKYASVLITTRQLHQDARQFPEPDKFDPDRWLPENVSKRHPFSYAQFSAGPRNCIGQKFASMAMKVELCYFFKRFQVKSLQTRDEIRPATEAVLRSFNGLIVQLTERKINQD